MEWFIHSNIRSMLGWSLIVFWLLVHKNYQYQDRSRLPGVTGTLLPKTCHWGVHTRAGSGSNKQTTTANRQQLTVNNNLTTCIFNAVPSEFRRAGGILTSNGRPPHGNTAPDCIDIFGHRWPSSLCLSVSLFISS